MSLTTRISSRYTRIVSAQCRNNSSVISTRRHPLSVPSSYFHSLGEPHSKVVGGRASLFHHSSLNASASQRLGFSSVPPSPEKPERENSPPAKGRSTVGNNGAKAKENSPPAKGRSTVGNNGAKAKAKAKASGNAEAPEQREEPISEDSEKKLTIKDMLKLVIEKEKLVMARLNEIEKMQEEVLRSIAAMKNAVYNKISVSESLMRPRPKMWPPRPHCYCCDGRRPGLRLCAGLKMH